MIISFPIYLGSLQFDKTPHVQKKYLVNYVNLLQYCELYSPFKREVMCWKTSSVQGMVRPPIG